MNKCLILDERFSTTKSLSKTRPELSSFKEDEFVSLIVLPENSQRIGEGGLRKQGYYKCPASKPILTIITAVYNGERYLEETILSVINQSYDHVEFVIIDGGSSDGTIDIIKKYEHAIDYWVSEPDKGISDAFNKGVQLASGSYINFQGDGDGFVSPFALDNLTEQIEVNKHDLLSARIQRIDERGSVLYTSQYLKKFNKRSLLFRMSLPHQGLFTSLEYFKKYGLFDIDNTFCMDYEHLLRSYKDFPIVQTMDLVLANWRADGLGNNRDLEIFKEYNNIKRENYVAPRIILGLINIWTLSKYFIKSILR